MKEVKNLKIGGFTLIELLVVISIVGLLSSIVFSNVNFVREKARDVQRIASLNQIDLAIALYQDDNFGVPPGEEGVEYVNGNPEWIPGLAPKYISAVPSDPIDSGSYKFHYVRLGKNHEVISFLEQNGNDTACGDGGFSCQYYEKGSGEFLVIANPGASGWRFASSTSIVPEPPPTGTTTPPTTPPPTGTTTPPTGGGGGSSQCASGTSGNIVSTVSGTARVPTVTTNDPVCVDADSATFVGSINPNNSVTTGFFRYRSVSASSCTNTFGVRVPVTGGTNLGSGSQSVSLSSVYNLLTPFTTYYYCAGASNSLGTTYGLIKSFTTTASTTAAEGSHIAISSGVQPASGFAAQGAYSVPFTTFVLANNSDTKSYTYDFYVKRIGTAPDSVLKRILIQTLTPTMQTVASQYSAISPGVWMIGRPNYVYTFQLSPGETKTFTIQADIADNISSYVGQTIGFELSQINVSLPVVGVRPVVGSLHTLTAP